MKHSFIKASLPWGDVSAVPRSSEGPFVLPGLNWAIVSTCSAYRFDLGQLAVTNLPAKISEETVVLPAPRHNGCGRIIGKRKTLPRLTRTRVPFYREADVA